MKRFFSLFMLIFLVGTSAFPKTIDVDKTKNTVVSKPIQIDESKTRNAVIRLELAVDNDFAEPVTNLQILITSENKSNVIVTTAFFGVSNTKDEDNIFRPNVDTFYPRYDHYSGMYKALVVLRNVNIENLLNSNKIRILTEKNNYDISLTRGDLTNIRKAYDKAYKEAIVLFNYKTDDTYGF